MAEERTERRLAAIMSADVASARNFTRIELNEGKADSLIMFRTPIEIAITTRYMRAATYIRLSTMASASLPSKPALNTGFNVRPCSSSRKHR